jgi:carboxymethylenebutenolidase
MSATIVSNELSYPCPDGFAMKSYLARPDREGTFPGIVLIVEATGAHREMKRIADDIASVGYAVIVPDLFSRGNTFLCLIRLLKDLKAERGRGVDDLLAARTWLLAQPFVDSDRIATMGFCLGGGFALVLAKTGLFKAAGDFYGEPPKTLDGACPVVASYGDKDDLMMPRVPALRAELERLNIPSDVKVYPNVGHGFMNVQPNALMGLLLRYTPGHGGYDRSAADDALERLLTFLSAHV